MYQLHIAICAALYANSTQANSSQQVVSFESYDQAEKAMHHLAMAYLPEGYSRTITRLYDTR